MHGKTAVIALLPLLIWGAYRATTDARNNGAVQSVEIGVEHSEPAQVHLTRSLNGKVRIVDIGNDSTNDVYVSLPDSWERGEVRNVPLASLTADSPSFGYRRWALPAGAVVTFHPVQDWRSLTVHNASNSLLQMKVTSVDLTLDTTDTNVYLVNDSPLSVQF